jgi:hypothetical protein
MARALDPQVTEAMRVSFFFWEGGERWKSLTYVIDMFFM